MFSSPQILSIFLCDEENEVCERQKRGQKAKNNKKTFASKGFLHMGWEMGLEPTISRATIWRVNQLRYNHHKSCVYHNTRLF